MLLKLTDTASVARSFIGSDWPCFHTNLMRNISLANQALGVVNDDIEGRAPVTAKELLTAPVPALCQHSAGQLVNGQLPVSDPNTGYVQLVMQPDRLAAGPVFADLTGEGHGDAAVVATCSAGGVNWPQHVLFYAPGPQLIGDIDLSAVYSDEHADVQTMTVQGSDLAITWRTYTGAGFDFRDWSGRVRWDGSTMRLVDTRQTG